MSVTMEAKTREDAIYLLVRGLFHFLPNPGQAGRESLPLIQRLGAHLSGVIHPHQAR